MDIRKVKKLIELLEESGVAEIEIKDALRLAPGEPTTQLTWAAAELAGLHMPAKVAIALGESQQARRRNSCDRSTHSPPRAGFFASGCFPSPFTKEKLAALLTPA